MPGAAGASDTVAAGSEFPIPTPSVAAVPSALPSFGVTSTVTVSPALPLPACARSSVSVSELVPGVDLTVTPFTFQT